jgi:hypothetical protein
MSKYSSASGRVQTADCKENSNYASNLMQLAMSQLAQHTGLPKETLIL